MLSPIFQGLGMPQNLAPPNPFVVLFDADEENYLSDSHIETLTDKSGRGNHGTQTDNTKQPIYRTDDGNYFDFSGNSAKFLNVPDLFQILNSTDGAQMYLVVKPLSDYTRFCHFVGIGGNDLQSGYDSATYLGNFYESFCTTTRKDAISPPDSIVNQWIVYNVKSRNGFYEMRVNSTLVFTSTSNVFYLFSGNVFGSARDEINHYCKYFAVLKDTTTDLNADLMTRFNIS